MPEVAPDIIRTAKFKHALLKECYQQRRAVKIECDSPTDAAALQSNLLNMIKRARQWPESAGLGGADLNRFVVRRVDATIIVAYLPDSLTT